jgi:hypothetical protein
LQDQLQRTTLLLTGVQEAPPPARHSFATETTLVALGVAALTTVSPATREMSLSAVSACSEENTAVLGVRCRA